ncbi:hypothetical protein F2P56_033388 [Juglans regia]|uniref:RNase H type-1 domain-containing protein n=1 Tax=Juglans regia TaxID=51240 RepID=A0A833SUU2_JUGRE|nr:hypothetical protein F2P56_033388 [Juglans regia]
MGHHSNNYSELMGLLHGLRYIGLMGFLFVEIELDSLIVLNWLKNQRCGLWYMEDYWDEIQSRIAGINVSFVLCYRECNSVADGLAKMGANGILGSWLSLPELPPAIRGCSLKSNKSSKMNTRHRPTRALPSSSLVRMAIRISRARWFSFLRRVFHYQNESRSNLSSNPFNSSTWMLMEFIVLVIQISIITSTIVIFKEKPVWPMRIWIIGYNIGCVLSLLLLYGRYRCHLNHGDGFGLSDVE